MTLLIAKLKMISTGFGINMFLIYTFYKVAQRLCHDNTIKGYFKIILIFMPQS
jgi:hypothetical protein